MTRTEMLRRELDEKERHNREEEVIGKAGIVVNAAKALMGKGGFTGLLPGSKSDGKSGGRSSKFADKSEKEKKYGKE